MLEAILKTLDEKIKSLEFSLSYVTNQNKQLQNELDHANEAVRKAELENEELLQELAKLRGATPCQM